MVSLTFRPNMTIAVFCGRKIVTQFNITAICFLHFKLAYKKGQEELFLLPWYQCLCNRVKLYHIESLKNSGRTV